MNATRPRVTRLLDLNDPAEIEQFERGFFAGFSHATHNRLVRWLWDWDHENRRLRTRIPYAEQRIWALTDAAGGLGAAISVNVRLRELQAAAYGFAVPDGLVASVAAGRVCEFLTFFVVGDHTLASKHALWTEMFDELRVAGFTHALATTAPKILPMYRRMGVRVLGEAAMEGEVRYFLQFDLTATAETRRAAG